MLRVTNFGAACCVIEGNGIRILCDPWFTKGAYHGLWEREDYIADPLTVIGQCDYVWISHCHPDHYDPVFLRQYLSAYPAAKVWIGNAPFLARIMERDGIPFVSHCSIHWPTPGPSIDAWVIPNNGYGADDIDTALVICDRGSAIINLNDCPYDQAQVDTINRLTAGKHVTALIPHTGAGPWPQAYDGLGEGLTSAATRKAEKFLAQFERYRVALRADVAAPFSAGYLLRGPLARLNEYRGIPHVGDVPNATILPVVGASPRPADDFSGYEWEHDPMPTHEELHGLIASAEMRTPKVQGAPLTIDLSWGTGAAYVDATYEPAIKAHETITFDPRQLAGMLRGKYHANNFEIGSVRIRRHGADYDSRVWSYLYRLRA